MVNNIDEILELTKEISFQDTEEVDFAVTKFGEELINTKDLEFLWVARNATNIVKNKSSDIKTLVIKKWPKILKEMVLSDWGTKFLFITNHTTGRFKT